MCGHVMFDKLSTVEGKAADQASSSANPDLSFDLFWTGRVALILGLARQFHTFFFVPFDASDEARQQEQDRIGRRCYQDNLTPSRPAGSRGVQVWIASHALRHPLPAPSRA
jgi:hypothetical protein